MNPLLGPQDCFDIGFLGGGQLARMSIQAAQKMGLRCASLDPGETTPASQIAPAVVGALDDVEATALFAERCERLTLENEFIPAISLREGLERAAFDPALLIPNIDRKSTRLNSSHIQKSRMPSSA